VKIFTALLALTIAVCFTHYLRGNAEADTAPASPAKVRFVQDKVQGPITGKFESKALTERALTVADIALLIREWRRDEFAEITLEESTEYAKAIFEAYVETGFDPYLLAATGFHESRYFRDSVSSAGAVGPWQQLPRYSGVFSDDCWEGSRMICRIYDTLSPIPVSELRDSYTSALVAARHLTYLYNRYSESDLTDSQNLRSALAHYNGGNNPVRECWTEYADVILLRAYGDPNQFN